MIFPAKLKTLLSNPWLKFLAASGLLWLVFRQVNLADLAHKLLTVQPAGWIIYLLGSVFLAWLAGWRWALLALPRPVTLTDIWHFFRATMLGLFYNLFMPSSTGGDVLKWTSLTHLPVSKQKLIFTMLLDRFMGMMALITVGFLALVLAAVTHTAMVPVIFWYFFSGLFVGVIGFFVLVFSKLSWSQLPYLNKITWVAGAEEYLELHRSRFLAVFGLAVLVQIICVLIEFALAWAVGFQVPFTQFMVVGPILGMVVALPLNFAGFGATEAGFVYFFSQLGVPTSTILALTSLMAILRFVLGGLGWLIGLIGKSSHPTQTPS
jgi:hypothetical protein